MIDIHLLKTGMTMTEGTISEWYVQNGDEVAEGQPLYALETEKITMDVESPASGTLQQLVDAGVVLEVAQLIGRIWQDGESATAMETVGTTSMLAAGESTGAESVVSSGAVGRDVSPLVRRLARRLDIDVSTVRGSGAGGRVTKGDIERAASRSSVDAAVQDSDSTRALLGEEMSPMRRTIAGGLVASLTNAAQLTMDMVVDVSELVLLRERICSTWPPPETPSFTDFVVKAVADSLEAHPRLNAYADGTTIRYYPDASVGLAIAVEDGLLVPTVQASRARTLRELALETKRLATAARSGVLQAGDVADAGFTITSLGMFGVDSFTPILPLRQAAILGVNRISDEVAWRDDQAYPRRVMRLSLTWDHRLVDGAPAANFLGDVRRLLEAPLQLLS